MLHGGYEVWIADSRKQPLPEYSVEFGDGGKTITCYIPSQSGEVSVSRCPCSVPNAPSTTRAPALQICMSC